eukprot:scaffold8043_cov61-Phaeocystis_antarctica.AAC.3
MPHDHALVALLAVLADAAVLAVAARHGVGREAVQRVGRAEQVLPLGPLAALGDVVGGRRRATVLEDGARAGHVDVRQDDELGA